MPTTLLTPPPARAFLGSGIWVRLQTTVTVSPPASVALSFSGAGPAEGNTLRLVWAGNDITFTASATNTASAFDLPLKGAETLAEYAALVAERLMQCEAIGVYFSVGVSGSTLTLTQRLFAVVDIAATSSLANTTVTVTDLISLSQPDLLAALVQVWADTGSLATDTLLLALHAPYPLPNNIVAVDISAAFASLGPHLPASATINPLIFPTTQPYGLASSAYTRYYLRHADKGGVPAVSEGLVKTASYLALWGAASPDSAHTASLPLRHAYARRDGVAFRKPVTALQPDYIYWVAPTGVTSVYVGVTAYWSDGTESAHTPYGTTGVAVTPGEMYWFPSGYWQSKLHVVTPPVGTDPDAYIVAYSARIARTDGSPMLGQHTVLHDVYPQGDWPALFLLFDNGVGGCETVALRGKWAYKFAAQGEEYESPRTYQWTAEQGELFASDQTGRWSIEANTGWLPEPFYLEHLRQLSIATKVWLVDVSKRRFLRVTIAPGEQEYNRADTTLFAQTFVIRAAWRDQTANV
jgi:hypothetical protein